MKPNRMMVNICAKDLQASKAFYTRWFGFEVGFESDWFIALSDASPQTSKAFEIGLLKSGHALVPEQFQSLDDSQQARGVYLTFVVDDVNALFGHMQQAGCNLIQPPENTDYGQRRCLVADPDGVLIDISSLAG